ncbi:GNAT family N-acetyltransferase [Polaribacter sp.]|nr:GNAT family N-acetyltransferase [Polaribacter sp.]
MKPCTITNNALYFSSISEISEEIWEALNCEKNLYFHRDFLLSIEENNSEIRFTYIVLLDTKKTPIAFASLQFVDFYVDDIKNDLEVLVRKIKNVGRKLHLFPKKKPLKILICGNTFVSGEHGVFIEKNQNKKTILKELAKAILHFVNGSPILKKEVNFFLVKDFINESLSISDSLKDYNYSPFLVAPNMLLYLAENWQTFEDYLAALKTKFRVKAKKALQRSASLIREDVTLENIEKLLPEMTALYKKVSSKADFNLGDFNLETYIHLKEKLHDNYLLKVYFLDGKVVGFMSGIINQNSLDAHFVGIDYLLNKEYAIYQRMLYDYIKIAIQKRIKLLNFGRTASEIKSSIGAIPQDLTMYIRHKKSIKNRILKLFLQRIEPTPFHQRFPFKKVTENEKR